METKKILIIGLVITTLVFATFTPTTKIVSADSEDTVDIIFKITCNLTIEIQPGSYNFSTMYSNTSQSTDATYFTIWNNGTVTSLVIEANITTPPSDPALNCSTTGPPTIANSYALQGLKGTVSDQPWYKDSGYVTLDSDLDIETSHTFGLKLYAGNVTTNTSWESMTITYRIQT